MDFEKAYDRVDRKGLWETLRVYGMGGQLLEGVRSFYENASASVGVNGELSESFMVEVGVRQGCAMLPWLFNIYMDGCIKEMKVRVWDLGARLNVRGVEQLLVVGLFADDIVLLAESEGMPQRIVDEFERVCTRRKLKVNAGKSKVMVFERAREQTVDVAKPYRVWSEAIPDCKIWLGKKMEVNEFKYLGTILCKHGSIEGEMRERTRVGIKNPTQKNSPPKNKKKRPVFFFFFFFFFWLFCFFYFTFFYHLYPRIQLKGKSKWYYYSYKCE